MKKRIFSIFLALAILASLIPSFAQEASAASVSWPELSSSSYALYIAPAGTYSVYRNTNMSIRGTVSPSKSYNSRIDAGDDLRLMGFVKNGKGIIVSFPVGRTRRTAIVPTKTLLGASKPQESFIANASVPVYKIVGNTVTRWGSTSVGDRIIRFGTLKGGEYILAFYTAVSGAQAWKVGFFKASDFQKIKGSDSTSAPSSSGWRMPMDNAYCTWRSYSNMSWASYTNRSGNRDYHVGLDIYGSGGRVYAAAGGKVVACSSSTSGANGRYIVIQHTVSGKTVYSFYAHLASVKVYKGQTVSKGTLIGIAGGSGYGKNNYYGTHLHFSIANKFSNGGYYGYVPYFTGNKVTYNGTTYYNPLYVINNGRLP